MQKLQEIEYKTPQGAKRVPWVDTLAIEGPHGMPKGVKAKDGVKLESTFLGIASEAVKEAYRRLRVMKIPCSRPSDFYAEMLKTDKQMFRVRQLAAEEQRRMKIVEDRRKSQAAKKFAKNAKSKKNERRAEEKRQSLDEISKWREKSKGEKSDDADRDLDDILDNRRGKKDKGKGKGKGKGEKSKKRKAADAKYGFGGKKRFKKSNDKSSVNDFSSSPWGAKGKGKGKGKGKRKGGGAVAGGKGGGPSGKKRKR